MKLKEKVTGVFTGLIILNFLSLPLVASADGLTAVFGFQILHLLVGNLLIGLVEAIYVKKRHSIKVNIPLIILGNYVSMFSGFLVAGAVTTAFGFGDGFSGFTANVSEYRAALAVGIFVSFLVTLLVELPFYKWATKTSWKTALKIELMPNIITNIAVLIVYFFIPPGK